MIRLSNLADYAVVVMAAAARSRDPRLSAASVAAATSLPVPTVAKLMGALARAGLLRSSRGVAGGFSLAREAAAISLADVVEAIEGPIAMTQCQGHTPSDCQLEGSCQVRPHLGIINRTVREALAAVTLAQLAGESAGAKPVREFA